MSMAYTAEAKLVFDELNYNKSYSHKLAKTNRMLKKKARKAERSTKPRTHDMLDQLQQEREEEAWEAIDDSHAAEDAAEYDADCGYDEDEQRFIDYCEYVEMQERLSALYDDNSDYY